MGRFTRKSRREGGKAGKIPIAKGRALIRGVLTGSRRFGKDSVSNVGFKRSLMRKKGEDQ